MNSVKALLSPFSVAAFLLSGLSGCGGGSPSAPTYQIGGSVTGLLTGNTVILQNNGGNTTPVSVNASFSFSTRLGSGSQYAVTISAQPEGESCKVSNASGVVASANVSIAVSCTPNPYSVGGTVTGLLSGNQFVLTNNGASGITVSANGSFTFSPASSSGSAYSVAVAQQPAGQSCAVTNGSGTLAGSNVSDVTVACSSLGYTVTANVFGILPTGTIQLQDNGGDDLTASATGSYTFKTSIATRQPYAVTVQAQPSGQTCFTKDGNGNVGTSNVTVTVICPWHVAYLINGATSLYYIDPATGSLLPGNTTQIPGAFVAIAPNRKHAYVANANGITVYAIDDHTGALTSLSTQAGTTNNPVTIAIDPGGKFLYAGNAGYPNAGQGQQNISAFAIDSATGGLTPINGSLLAGIVSPSSMTVDSTGKYLISSGAVYSIDQVTGGLTAVSGSTGTGGFGPTSLTYDSNGPFVYSVGQFSPGAYDFNSVTGQLTAIAGSTSLPANASSITVTPDGRHAYAIITGSVQTTAVQAFNIDQTSGVLSPVTGGSYAVTVNAIAIAVDPSGQYVYVSNYLYPGAAFSINGSTGALAPVVNHSFDTAAFAPAFGYSLAILSLM